MKKFFTLLLCFTYVFILLGCQNDKVLPTATPDPTATVKEATDKPTAEPSPKPTTAPMATIEPGKETYAGEVDDSVGILFNLTPTTGSIKDEMISDNLAAQFFATTTFNRIEISCVSYGNNVGTLVFNLYKWAGSYNATFEKEPVATKEFVDFNDNSVLSLNFTEDFPDGEYIIELSTEDSGEGVGVYTNQDVEDGKTRLYKSGDVVENAGLYMAINYTKTPANLVGPMQDPNF